MLVSEGGKSRCDARRTANSVISDEFTGSLAVCVLVVSASVSLSVLVYVCVEDLDSILKMEV